jgi:hypothetical protein
MTQIAVFQNIKLSEPQPFPGRSRLGNLIRHPIDCACIFGQ